MNSNPYDLTTGADGNLWFTEQGAMRIGRITPAGQITEFRLPKGTFGHGPFHIISGPDGNLWYSHSDDRIGRISTAGEIHEFQLPPDSGGGPLVSGPDGNVWYVRYGYPPAIARVTPDGTMQEFALPVGAATPHSLTVGPEGALWFAPGPKAEREIGRITLDGTISSVPLPIFDVSDVVTGPDGNLWFTEDEPSPLVGRRHTDGSYLTFQFDKPAPEIISAPDGHLWLTTTEGLARLSIDGVVERFATGTAAYAPQGLTYGPDGDLWFVEADGYVVRAAPPPTLTPNPTPVPLPDQVYVGAGGEIVVVDPQNEEVATHIKQAGAPLIARPDGEALYANCPNLCVIETATNVRRKIFLGPTMNSISRGLSGTRFYVREFDYPTTQIAVVDASSGSVLRRLTLSEPVVPGPSSNDQFLVAISPQNQITFFSLNDGKVVRRVPLFLVRQTAFSHDGQLLYAVGETPGAMQYQLVAIDATSGAIVNSVDVNGLPGALELDPSGQYAYVGGDHLTVVDLPSMSVIGEIPLPPRTNIVRLAFAPDGHRGYALDTLAHALLVVDTVHRTILQSITLDVQASDLVVVHRADITPPATRTSTPTVTSTFKTPPPTVTPTPTLSRSLDCDHNGVLDSSELSTGAPDCNDNGVLDVCDVGRVVPLSAGEFMAQAVDVESVVVADFNNDGRADIAFGGRFSNAVSILWNLGDRRFSAPQQVPLGSDVNFLAAGDMDKDGHVDLVVSTDSPDGVSGDITVIRNRGAGTFDAPQRSPSHRLPGKIVLADLNGDHILDTVQAVGSLSVRLNSGDGSLGAPTDLRLHYDADLFDVADVDGDGDADVIVPEAAGLNTGIGVFVNDGHGAFSLRQIVHRDDGIVSTLAVDVDGDAIPDIVAQPPGGGTVDVYRNRGDGSFAPVRRYPVPSRAAFPVAGDINGDGMLDLVLVNLDSGTLYVLLNDGRGGFVQPPTFAGAGYPIIPAIGDLDGDGRAEVVVGYRSSYGLQIFWNASGYTPAQTTSLDCNGNRIPDECDARSDDCDRNGIPDACDPDADGDGVPDACDRCPGADDRVDSDRDTVPDCLDGCPQNPDKREPGICGCFIPDDDSDGDGIPDCVDNCIQVPNHDQTNSDGDRTGDACDGCPFDAAKIAPGVCGCGALEQPFDADTDGIPDCRDLCSGSTMKMDSDGDGVVDCLDVCPADAAVPREGGGVALLIGNARNTLMAVNLAYPFAISTKAVEGVPRAIAAGRSGLRGWLATSDPNAMSAFDPHTLETLDRIDIEESPMGMAVADGDQRVFVLGENVASGESKLYILSASPLALASSVALDPDAMGLAVPPTGDVAYVTHAHANVSRIDTQTGIVGKLPYGGIAVAVTPDDKTLIVSGCNRGVCLYDRKTGTARGMIPSHGSSPLVVAPDGIRAYVANTADGYVDILDLASHSIAGQIPANPRDLAVAADSQVLYFLRVPCVGGSCTPLGFLGRVDLQGALDQPETPLPDAVRAIALLPDRRGDANCDDTVTAADLPALLLGYHNGTRSACRFDDADSNCLVDARDPDALIGKIFSLRR